MRSLFATGVLAALVSLVSPSAQALRSDGAAAQHDALQAKCDPVLFEKQNDALKTRTMVVELTNHDGRQRALVLTHSNDTSEPCALKWWLDHDPQGLVVCEDDSSKQHPPKGQAEACHKGGAALPCVPKTDDIWNGYVRTMLATVIYSPKAASLVSSSARGSSSFLQQGDAVDGWVPRKGFSAGRVAVLGLGSSTMALWMRKHLPHVGLSVAELVDGVAESAPCFGLDVQGDKGLEIKVADGRAFLESSKDGAFDAILVDAFDADLGLPSCFKTREFFELTAKKLAPGGALAFNALTYQKDTTRVLSSLQGGFGGSSAGFYVGNAPGADGIQEVVVAYKNQQGAPGKEGNTFAVPFRLDAMERKEQQDAPAGGVAHWLERAEFKELDLGEDKKSSAAREPYTDAEMHCSSAAKKGKA